MDGHARKCVERYCELANKKVEQLCKVSSPYIDDHQFRQEELESFGEISPLCSQIVLKCLHLARIGRQDKTRQEERREEREERRGKREERREKRRDIFKYTHKCVSIRRRLVTHVSVHTLTFHETHYPLSPPGDHRTIQYLIPGRTTNVELLKTAKT